MKLGEIVLSLFAAAVVVTSALALNSVEKDVGKARAHTQDMQVGMATCERELTREKSRADAAESLVQHAEYYLWEVHALDRDPRTSLGDDTTLEHTCETIGDRSVLRDNTELHGYSLWNDATGHLKLGCRFVRRKEQP